MLTFLRRIRKSLIESGTTRKYLLYAFGEIALVVIGILIALQINNYNEWRKDRVIERKILVDLAKNLEMNIDRLEDQLEKIERHSRSGDVIFSAMESETEDLMIWVFTGTEHY